MAAKKLGVLTSGGDCPGLNSAIKAVTKRALQEGYKVIGIRDGFKGLISHDSDLLVELTADVVRHIDRLGGTILGTSRTNPFQVSDGIDGVDKCWRRLGLDALITIGGEGTLSVANQLFEQKKMRIIGIPKTIDHDLSCTEYCLGFESAVQVITDSIDALRSTAESHARVFVVEVMGRHSGHLALHGGISAGANIILVPEYPFEIERVCELLQERQKRKLRYSIVVAAEEAIPRGKDKTFKQTCLHGIGEWLAQKIYQCTKIETRSVNLSHLQRGGRPVAYDRRLGYYFGTAAVEGVLKEKFGMMTALINGRIQLVPLKEATATLNIVNIEHEYDTRHYWSKAEILGS